MARDTLLPVNPATGAALPEVACSSGTELTAIVAAARAAQPAWDALGVQARAQRIRAFALALTEGDVASKLAASITREMGKPIKYARAEVRSVASRIESFITRAQEACQDERATEGDIRVVVQWRPLGVAAVIAPWNYPVITPINLLLSALLTGNTAVFKPSEYTPHTGEMLCGLLCEVLPAGVLGLVQGDGTVGAMLVDSAVDMVAFTGSIATGQAIMRSCASGMKRIVLELGGKDPMIVLPGADLDAAAEHAVRNALMNTGQVCVAVERILVDNSIHDEFVARVVARASEFQAGDPMQEQTELGPLANARQRDIVLEQLHDAKRRGAKFLLSGEAYGPGFFLQPTVVDDVTQDMILARDETFGPVLAISSVSGSEEALARANDTRYGLGASVWGPPGPGLEALANRIHAGMVGVNRGLSAAAGAPWVGWKMSGFGYTRSTAGMRSFMQPRSLSFPSG